MTGARLGRFLLGAALAGVARAEGAPPEVTQVEPPGWWAGHSINPVRLMLRGRALAGARVEGAGGTGPCTPPRASGSPPVARC